MTWNIFQKSKKAGLFDESIAYLFITVLGILVELYLFSSNVIYQVFSNCETHIITI